MMWAVVVHEPGGPEVLRLEERPIPEPKPGWVLGIECVGEVIDVPASLLQPGQRILAAMGGMGRDYDGGYEQYALLPASQVIPVETTLDWPKLGAIPESFGTAWGAGADRCSRRSPGSSSRTRA
jgi:NADPH:quinone reductase-like Zn-dependent oxidoreductase